MNTRLSALDIKKKEFEQKMRGYDAIEVRAYLDIVSQEMDALTIEKAQAEQELADTKKRLEHFLGLEQTLERTLVGAQQTSIKMEEQARKEAELIIREAELKRDQALNNINSELDKTQGELFRLRAEYDSTLVRMRALMSGFGSFMERLEADAKLSMPDAPIPVASTNGQEQPTIVAPTPADSLPSIGGAPTLEFSL
jgi:cell division initiation protein